MSGDIKKLAIAGEDFSVRNQCRICGSRRLEMFFSLGNSPLANNLYDNSELAKTQKYYPLEVCLCQDCYLVQLIHIVNPKILFSRYAYSTGRSIPMNDHFSSLAQTIAKNFRLDANSLVVDVGSNDGTLLSHFLKLNLKVLGIDPAENIAELARKKGVETVNALFNIETAKKVINDFGRARVILATNVFAHVDNLDEFVRAVDCLLDKEGVFVIEVPYLLNLLRNAEFDTIYHEHLSYFSIHPLDQLFKKFKMQIVDIKELSVHGGSVRIFVQREGTRPSNALNDFLLKEDKFGIKDVATYTNFSGKVENLEEKLRNILFDLKIGNKKIYGYGASAKSTTLLNYCNIDDNIIECICDTTPFKQGKFAPGTGIPIVPDSRLLEEMPDYSLILAWNYKEHILLKEAEYIKRGGRFIMPIPEPEIISS